MQQATGAAGLDSTASGNSLPSESERYVINLSASTTPVGLTAPTHAQLRHYTFFVSRKLENGRERFRLHMGYFGSLDEAEHMLELVREIYPAAWAGAAPGQRLHTRVIAAGKLGGKPGARPTTAPVPAHAAATPAPVAAAMAPAPAASGIVAPVVPVQVVVPSVAPVVACVVPAHPGTATAQPVAPAAEAPAAATAATVAPAAVATAAVATAAVAPVAKPAIAPAAAKAAAASESFQQIRATIDSLGAPTEGTLDGTGNTVIAPGINALRQAEASGARALSGQQALALLEQPPREYVAPAARPAAAATASPAARTRPGSALPAATPAAPFYAVQLLWAVQPIDMERVPQLAIFGAYRLYGAEGNRDGRRWYGLRLGFFADSVSAQQVANYVRSEFSSVSVVPVSAGERERATRSTAQPMPAARSEERGHGLQFIDEASTDTPSSGGRPAPNEAAAAAPADAEAAWAAAASAAVQGGPAARKGVAPGKRAKLRVGKGAASKRQPPETLEQTLDALGASTLSLDDGRGERLPFESTAGRLPAPPPPNRFGKLLDRLTKRFGSV